MFYGKKKQRLTSLSPVDDALHQASIHEKEDLFSHLHVNVADEGFDLYDGLARYFDDVVELGGQKKRMEVSLVDLPPLLQIQLQVRLVRVYIRVLCPDVHALSAYNSTARRSKRTSLRRTSSLEKRSIWIAFWIARIRRRRHVRRRSKPSSPLHAIVSISLLRER